MNGKDNPPKKFSLAQVLNDDPAFLLERVRATAPKTQSATLHSARAQIELLEAIYKCVKKIEQQTEGISHERKKDN